MNTNTRFSSLHGHVLHVVSSEAFEASALLAPRRSKVQDVQIAALRSSRRMPERSRVREEPSPASGEGKGEGLR